MKQDFMSLEEAALFGPPPFPTAFDVALGVVMCAGVIVLVVCR